MGRDFVDSIAAQFRRYQALAEGAMGQLDADELSRTRSGADNSVATLVWHISGNLTSRFTDFLASDGEKPWRDREAEFEPREVSRAELEDRWQAGWDVLFDALAALGDEDLHRWVAIRGVELRVHSALHRSLAHTAHHVGQIVYVSKMLRGEAWTYLSIPPGASEAYNRNPTLESPVDHAARVADHVDDHPREGDT